MQSVFLSRGGQRGLLSAQCTRIRPPCCSAPRPAEANEVSRSLGLGTGYRGICICGLSGVSSSGNFIINTLATDCCDGLSFQMVLLVLDEREVALGSATIWAEMITEMRGADLMFFSN